MINYTNTNQIESVRGEGSTGIFKKINSDRLDSGYNTPEARKQDLDSERILQILCQLPLGYNTPEIKSTQKAVKETKLEESTLIEKRVIIDTGIFDRPILIQLTDNELTEDTIIEEVATVEEPIPETRADTGLWWLFAKPEVAEIVEPAPEATRIIIDTGIFDRPILIQNVEPEVRTKEVIVEETPIVEEISIEEVSIKEMSMEEIPVVEIDPIVEEVSVIEDASVAEVTRIIIDTGIFDRPILIQNVEPEVVSREVEETPIVEEISIEEAQAVEEIPEIRADTGLWWLFAKPEITEVVEPAPEATRIIIDTGIFDRPILIQNVEKVEPVVESAPEATRIIIDTGIFDRPILIQNVENVEPEVTTREVVVEEAPKSERIIQPLIRLPLVFDYLFNRSKTEAVVETPKEVPAEEASKVIIIDTGYFRSSNFNSKCRKC